jgi:hypothetical protein
MLWGHKQALFHHLNHLIMNQSLQRCRDGVLSTTNFTKRPGFLKNFRSFLTICCLAMGLLFSITSKAQTAPADCTQGCTSNDVQIKTAYLSDASGNKLDNTFVCPQSGTAQVYLTLELTTKTPRVGVAIFTRIKLFTPPSTIGAEVTGSPISQCFGIALNQPTNKVTFTGAFTWTCGSAIVMTDVFIGWGTGNTNFCGTNTSFICPATPSKCYQLPNGSFIAIITPTSGTASQTKCSTAPGGTTATFNLTDSDPALINGQTGVHVRWYSDAAGTIELTGTGKTAFVNTTNPQTVYAKVCNDPSPGTVCSSLQSVVLTVVPSSVGGTVTSAQEICSGSSPNNLTLSGNTGSVVKWQKSTDNFVSNTTDIANTTTTLSPGALTQDTWYRAVVQSGVCASANSNAVKITVDAASAGGTVASAQTICSGSTPNDLTLSGKTGDVVKWQKSTDNFVSNTTDIANTTTTLSPGALTQDTWYRAVVLNGVCASANSNAVKITVGANPGKPDFTITEPSLCGSSTGSINVCQTIIGYDYKVPGKTTKSGDGAAYSFTGLAAGSNPTLEVINTTGGCSSGTFTCTDAVESCSSATSRASVTTENVTQSQTTVKAYPNPFSDKVKFVVTSAVSGQGNLEVYNMMGQRVKTIYQGLIAAGTQTFELSMPTQQIANLVYVLRVGDKKVSGKLLQINQ